MSGRSTWKSGVHKYILDEKKAPIGINWKNNAGYTLVHKTIVNAWSSEVREMSIRILSYLITEKHADFEIPAGVKKWTPLHYAAYYKRGDAMKYLLDCGADVGKQDIEGNTAHLIVSAYHNLGKSIELGKILLERGANVNQKNNDNKTPLDIALFQEYNQLTFEEFKILLEHGANMNWTNSNDESLVHVAVIQNGMDFLDYLVRDKHVEINTARKMDNWTPLHCAAFWNHFEICKYLIEHGADIRAKTECGKTPAQIASDRELIDYMGQASTSKRYRRSLQENYFQTLLQNPTGREYRYEKIAGPVNKNPVSSSGDDLFFGLQTLNLLFRFFVRDSVNLSQTRQQASLSTVAILQGRMDPIVENAIHYLSNLTNS